MAETNSHTVRFSGLPGVDVTVSFDEESQMVTVDAGSGAAMSMSAGLLKRDPDPDVIAAEPLPELVDGVDR